MIEITTLRIWIGITLVWPFFWALVFDRWFFLSPLGLFIAFVIPAVGWLIWWKYYGGDGEKLVKDGKAFVDQGAKTLTKLRKRLSSQ